jgi:hypothetical protein
MHILYLSNGCRNNVGCFWGVNSASWEKQTFSTHLSLKSQTPKEYFDYFVERAPKIIGEKNNFQ